MSIDIFEISLGKIKKCGLGLYKCDLWLTPFCHCEPQRSNLSVPDRLSRLEIASSFLLAMTSKKHPQFCQRERQRRNLPIPDRLSCLEIASSFLLAMTSKKHIYDFIGMSGMGF
ncbi:MAG: hypothetical protein ABFC84_18435 [Veillonellales bacterium]